MNSLFSLYLREVVDLYGINSTVHYVFFFSCLVVVGPGCLSFMSRAFTSRLLCSYYSGSLDSATTCSFFAATPVPSTPRLSNYLQLLCSYSGSLDSLTQQLLAASLQLLRLPLTLFGIQLWRSFYTNGCNCAGVSTKF